LGKGKEVKTFVSSKKGRGKGNLLGGEAEHGKSAGFHFFAGSIKREGGSGNEFTRHRLWEFQPYCREKKKKDLEAFTNTLAETKGRENVHS